MVFLYGKFRDSAEISKVVTTQQFSYIFKLFHVKLYVFKATSYKLTKGTGFVADQTNLRVKHGLVTYLMLV